MHMKLGGKLYFRKFTTVDLRSVTFIVLHTYLSIGCTPRERRVVMVPMERRMVVPMCTYNSPIWSLRNALWLSQGLPTIVLHSPMERRVVDPICVLYGTLWSL